MELSGHIADRARLHLGAAYSGHRFLLAVSGGVDSMALLHAMKSTISRENLIVGHFDHRTRDASQRDALFVKEHCLKEGISFVQGKREGNGLSEDSLREERWEWLRRTRLLVGADYIVTAHHLEDQLETFFMRFIRGTGLSGLAVMSELNGRIFRPLLSVPRRAIEGYVLDRHLPSVEDETNALPLYFRNRIRAQLIPVLDNLSNEYGGPDRMRERFSALIRETRMYRDQVQTDLRAWFKSHVTETIFWVRIEVESLIGLETLEATTILKSLVEKYLGVKPTREDCERMLQAIRTGQKEVHIGGPVFLSTSCGWAYFQNLKQREARPRFLSHAPWVLSPELSFKGELSDRAKWRTVNDGDRFRGKKLKKLLLEQRVPRLERSLLPVLAGKGGEILWYPQAGPMPDGHARPTIGFPFSSASGPKSAGRVEV